MSSLNRLVLPEPLGPASATVSPEAIEWCHRRFPESSVDYRVADLFSLPEEWTQSFDLVVDYTSNDNWLGSC